MNNNVRLPEQPPATRLSRREWDAVVVGAGPAGASCAYHLAARGHTVLLLDRARFPREKVCGEGILADALKPLGEMGAEAEVRAAGYPVPHLSVFTASRIEVEARGDQLTLRRSLLDAILVSRAVQAGSTFAEGRAEDVRAAPGGGVTVAVSTPQGLGEIRARAAVVATGARLALAQRAGLVPPGLERPTAVAVRCRIRSRTVLDRMVASFDRAVLPGYAWIFPLGDGEYNVGCGVFHRPQVPVPHLGDTLHHFLRSFPPARELMARGSIETPLGGAPLRCGFRGARPLGTGPLLATGETIGSTLPFTGEGIGKALETGAHAARAIHATLVGGDAAALSSYPDALRRAFSAKFRGYDVAQRWIAKPWVGDFLARRVRRSRHLRQAAIALLRDTGDPTAIFSVGGALRSLFR